MRIAIVAHLARITEAELLGKTVEAEYIGYDDGTLGCEKNHQRAWEWHAHHPSDWAVVLEDDAVPVPEFRRQLKAALQQAPTDVVSLYLGKSRPPQYQDQIAATTQAITDECWITSPHLLHAVGVAIKPHLLPDLLSLHSPLPADQHLSWWCKDRQHPVAYTWPSLVNHADGPTLVQHHDSAPRPPGRTAWQVGGRTTWTNKTIQMSTCPTLTA